MIVKNEEKNLQHCIDLARPYVDEMVIVDTGSTDRTVEIATAAGARVEHFTWCDDFAAARNYAFDQCRTPYALVLDADEWFSKLDEVQLKADIQSAMAQGVSLVTMNRNYVPQVCLGMLPNGKQYPDDQMGIGFCPTFRGFLFPKTLRYRGRVHELPDLESTGWHVSQCNMHHSGHMDKQREASKKWYYELGLIKLKEDGDNFQTRSELGTQAYFNGNYKAALGHWKRAVHFSPEDGPALMGLSSSMVALGKFKQARKTMRKARVIWKDCAEVIYNCAWIELFCGDAKRCEELCEETLRKFPSYVSAVMLGVVAMMCQDGNPDGVRALKLGPDGKPRFTKVDEALRSFLELFEKLGQTVCASNLRRALTGERS
jgi:glycosyltransferase involved in cell wall biosynthesis